MGHFNWIYRALPFVILCDSEGSVLRGVEGTAELILRQAQDEGGGINIERSFDDARRRLAVQHDTGFHGIADAMED
jgi:hypothetical protein